MDCNPICRMGASKLQTAHEQKERRRRVVTRPGVMSLRVKLCLLLIIGCHLLGESTTTNHLVRKIPSRVGGIQCSECADGVRWGTPMRPFGDHADGCSKMHPKVVKYVMCASNEDICVKTIMFGAGKSTDITPDVVTRQCMSLKSLRQHNPRLNMTQASLTDMCYTDKDFPSPSPPFKHRFCICHTDFCNSATILSMDYPFVTIAIAAFYIGFLM